MIALAVAAAAAGVWLYLITEWIRHGCNPRPRDRDNRRRPW